MHIQCTDIHFFSLQNGVNVNCTARVLLRSVKPVLNANVDCTPLVAAIISRQISTVELLIEVSSGIMKVFLAF